MSYSFVLNQAQRKMVEFCRTGNYDPAVRMPKERAEIYRDLIVANIDSALIKAYPLTHQLLNASDWERLVSEFFASSPQPFPSFWKMPQGLCDFVRKEEWGMRLNMPYLSDLVQFEWIEIEVYMMPNADKDAYDTQGDLMQDVLYVNPEHRFQTYHYPVFQQLPLPEDFPIGEYHLFCFRHPKTADVRFISLSRFYRTVLEKLIQGESTGREALEFAAQEYGIPLTERVFDSARAFYQDLFSQDAILGFQL